MPYSIQPAENVSDAVQRMALEQIDRAIGAIMDQSVPRTEAVYSLRKRCKKVRAILRLARGPLGDQGCYRPANVTLRDIAGRFSGLRDADVMLTTYDRMMAQLTSQTNRPPDRRRFGPVRAALTRRRAALLNAPDDDLAMLLDEAHWLLLKFRISVADWAFAEDGFQAVEPGLRKTYRRMMSAARAARNDGTVDDLHEWRKRLKYHRNHLRLLKKMAPRALAPRIKALWHLGDLLGLDHDLAVLHALVAEDEAFAGIRARAPFLALVDGIQRDTQTEAMLAAEELAFASEDTAISRLAGLWNIGMNRPVAMTGIVGS